MLHFKRRSLEKSTLDYKFSFEFVEFDIDSQSHVYEPLECNWTCADKMRIRTGVQSNIWPNVLPSAWTSSHSRLTALRRLKTNILRRLLLIRIPKHSSVCRCIPTTYNRYKWKKNRTIYLFLMKKFYIFFFECVFIHVISSSYLRMKEKNPKHVRFALIFALLKCWEQRQSKRQLCGQR